jgi:hypothetical protein
VMEAHRLLVDVRLQGRVVIRKRWNFECHASLLSVGQEEPKPLAILACPWAVSSAGRAGDS